MLVEVLIELPEIVEGDLGLGTLSQLPAHLPGTEMAQDRIADTLVGNGCKLLLRATDGLRRRVILA
ncbi:hypothetical protein D3C76_914630 [compost metagenome]